MSIRIQVLESIKWLFIAQMTSQLFRFGVTIYVIRQLDSEEMAYVALAQTVIGFLEMFSTMGLNSAIISKKDISLRELQSISGLILFINLCLSLLLLLASEYFAGFYGIPELGPILRVLSLAFIIGAIGTVSGSILTRNMQFKAIGMIQMVSGISGAAASFYAVIHGYGYWSIIIGGLAIQFVTMVMRVWICGQWIMPRFSLSESKEHLTFGGFVMGAGMAWYLFVSMDIVIAGKVWTVETVGVYAVAMQLAVMPLNKLLPLLKGVALPAFSKTWANDKQKIEAYLVKSLRLAMSVSFPFYFGMASLAVVLVPLLLGEKWQPVSVPLALLCISAPFRFFLELQGPAVIATGNPRPLFMYSLVIMLIMLSAFFAVVNISNDPASLALTWMTLYPLLALYVTKRYCVLMSVNFGRILQAISSSFIASIVMLAVVVGFTDYLGDKIGTISLLVASILLGAVVYIGLIFMLDKATVQEYRSFLRRRA